MALNDDQRLYQTSLELIKNEIIRARSLNQTSHIDFIKEVGKLLKAEAADMQEYHHI